MNDFIGPTQLEGMLKDIATFMETSVSPDKEKIRIMELIASYYEDRNMTEVDLVLGQLARATLRKSGQMEMFDEKG